MTTTTTTLPPQNMTTTTTTLPPQNMTTPTTTLPPHVLAIDDDAAMRQLIADYLGESDLRVTTVATGADMEKVLAEHAIDVVVLDLRLVGEDGMRTVKAFCRSARAKLVCMSEGEPRVAYLERAQIEPEGDAGSGLADRGPGPSRS